MTEELRPGLYRHYKGGMYTVLFIAEHHETREPQVIYISHEHRSINVRPLRGTPKYSETGLNRADPDGWLDEVNLNHGIVDGHGNPFAPDLVPRFVYVERVDEPVVDR